MADTLSLLTALSLGLSVQSSGPQSDPAAIVQLTQAATAAGALQAGVRDLHLSGSGSIVYNWGSQQVPGTFSVVWDPSSGLVLTSKTDLGTRTDSATPTAEVIVDEGGRVTPLDAHTAQRTMFKYFPAMDLATIEASTVALAVPSKAVDVDSQTANGVAVSGVWPTNTQEAAEQPVVFYLDPQTYLVVRRDDYIQMAPGWPGRLLRSLTYSDYRKVGGLFLPFSVSEKLNDQPVYTLTFSSLQAADSASLSRLP